MCVRACVRICVYLLACVRTCLCEFVSLRAVCLFYTPARGVSSYSGSFIHPFTRALQADRLAAGLLSLGVERGDRVGIWAHNCPEWILLQYATARAGMILVSRPSYRLHHCKYRHDVLTKCSLMCHTVLWAGLTLQPRKGLTLQV